VSKTSFLPEGPARPSDADLDAFWVKAKTAVPDLGDDYEVRWIGVDDPTTDLVIELIKKGEKTGTFGLPWVLEETGQASPKPGDPIVLIAYDGTPKLVVRLTEISQTTFGQIGPEHTAIDGPPVRDLAVWIPLHTKHWNGILKKYGREVSDDMPVLVEPFELVYSA